MENIDWYTFIASHDLKIQNPLSTCLVFIKKLNLLSHCFITPPAPLSIMGTAESCSAARASEVAYSGVSLPHYLIAEEASFY